MANPTTRPYRNCAKGQKCDPAKPLNVKLPKQDWLQKASKSFERKGTAGKFSAEAKAARMTTLAFARHVIKKFKGKNNSVANSALLKRAVFALNAINASKK